MATASWNAPMRLLNQTDWEQWAERTSNAIASLLTKTSDTGQIAKPITAARPTGTNQYAGYEIFRFNDAYQATYPIYLKVQYGFGGENGRPTLSIQTGTGSDGAGNITGSKLGPDTHMASAMGSDARVMEHAAGAGADGYFWICFGVADSSNGSCQFWYHCERMRNPDGTPTKGMYVGRLQQSSGSAVTMYFSVIPDQLAVQHVNNEFPVMYPATSGDYVSVAGEVPLFPIEPFYGRRQPPCLGMVGVRDIDVGAGVVIQTTLLGATRYFRKITSPNGITSAGSMGKGGYNSKCWAGRWE